MLVDKQSELMSDLLNRKILANLNYHMSIKTGQAILKCFIDVKSRVRFTLGSEDKPCFVTLRNFSARLPVKVFKTLNGRQSHILSKFHKSKKFSRSGLS